MSYTKYLKECMTIYNLPKPNAIEIIFCDCLDEIMGKPERAFDAVIYGHSHQILFAVFTEVELPVEDELERLVCENL